MDPICPFLLLLNHPHIFETIPLIPVPMRFCKYLLRVHISHANWENRSESVPLLRVFPTSRGHVEFFFLVAPAFPSTSNHILVSTYNLLINYVQILYTSQVTQGKNKCHRVPCPYQVILNLHRIKFSIWIQSICLNSDTPLLHPIL